MLATAAGETAWNLATTRMTRADVQDLAKQGSFAAASAHRWELRAVARSALAGTASAGLGAAAPMLEWDRQLLALPTGSASAGTAGDGATTLAALQTAPGSFARQLQGLARTLLAILGVRF
jgi:hypothetical protein